VQKAHKATQWVDESADRLCALCDEIWQYAEPGLIEFQSSKALATALETHGFEVQRGVAGMPTAFVASYGSGDPVIGILGEYDALPGLSQRVAPEKSPLEPGAAGHGCGHNLLGVGALGAAIAIKETMAHEGIEGTIQYFGCPAEETVVGKVFMARDGLFDHLDAALTWHPFSFNAVMAASSLAQNLVKFHFHGTSSHAAASPEAGRSALKAVQLMDTGVHYMREHVVDEARIHSVITEGGGEPNVVPAYAQIWYYVRAPRRQDVEEIYAWMLDIAKGAALMTGTSHDVEFIVGCYNLVPNDALNALLARRLEDVGPPPYTDEDRRFAEQLVKTFPAGQARLTARAFGLPEEMGEMVLHEDTAGILGAGRVLPGSTDVADVSWITPTAQFGMCCAPFGTSGHSWQQVASSGSGIGHRGTIAAAKVLALAGLDLLTDDALRKRARREFEDHVKRNGEYVPPIPGDLRPPLDLLKHD